MIIATILGIFGQSLAYFVNSNLLITLTVFTGVSILLYISVPILAFTMNFDKKYRSIYSLLFGIIGFCVSLWSIFVCLMWWG